MPWESWFLNVCLLWVSSLEDLLKEIMFKFWAEVAREVLKRLDGSLFESRKPECDGGDSRKF